ncbi:MAG: STAS domain-containing protein [Candidatus Omnitrophica bacterium]|nr:STAS domain-containing protein [Candidatus Omnitrophota bacterium]
MLRDFFKREGKEDPPDFIEKIEEFDNLDIVRLKGPIDMFTIPDIDDLRKKAISEKNFLKKDILLDFKGVTHVDGATCAMLVSVVSELKYEKHRLALINVSLDLRNMMDVSMIEHMFTIYETEKEALARLQKKEGS